MDKSVSVGIWCYGPYNGSYGTHAMAVRVGELTLWFSYQTVVAFQDGNRELVVSENVWGPTTGKHLNAIADKSRRIKRAEFETKLAAALEKHGLSVNVKP